jgi:hypothetical protein
MLRVEPRRPVSSLAAAEASPLSKFNCDTQAGRARLLPIWAIHEGRSEGGFGKVRKATETPFNMILEPRP